MCLNRLKRLPIQTETSERLVSILTALCQVRQVPEVASFVKIDISNRDGSNKDDDNECGVGALEKSGLVNAGEVTGDKWISIDGYYLYGKCLKVVRDILNK